MTGTKYVIVQLRNSTYWYFRGLNYKNQWTRNINLATNYSSQENAETVKIHLKNTNQTLDVFVSS